VRIKEHNPKLNEAAVRKKIVATLCKTEGSQRTVLSLQCTVEFAAHSLRLGFNDRFARLHTSEEENDFEKLKPQT
jgi:hypothetical protein